MNNQNYTTIEISNPKISKKLIINIPNHLIDDNDDLLMPQIELLNDFMKYYDQYTSSLKKITINSIISNINNCIERSGIILSLGYIFIDVYEQISMFGPNKLILELNDKDNVRIINITDSSKHKNDELRNDLLNGIGVELSGKSEDLTQTDSCNDKYHDLPVNSRNVYRPMPNLKVMMDALESKIKSNKEKSNNNDEINNKDLGECPKFVSDNYRIKERPIKPSERNIKDDKNIDDCKSFIRKDKLPCKEDDCHGIVLIIMPDRLRPSLNFGKIGIIINEVTHFYNERGIHVKMVNSDWDLVNCLNVFYTSIKNIFSFKVIKDKSILELINKCNIPIENASEPVHHQIVTLCGSRKFLDEFIKVKNYFSKLGWIVNMPASFDIPEDEWSHMSDIEIENFHSIHNQMMENSDLVYIVTKNGYYGENTRREIEYCEKRGITVQYHNMILN